MASLHSVIESGTVEFEHIRKQPSEGTDEISILDAALARVAVKESRIREAYESGLTPLKNTGIISLELQMSGRSCLPRLNG